jgi:ABC-2 type transport system ATP-binding protein
MVTPLTELPDAIDGVREIKKLNGRFRLILAEDAAPNKILKTLINQGVELTEFEIAVPPLNEIFIQVVQNKGGAIND